MYKGLNFILWLFWIHCMKRIWIQQTISNSIQSWSHVICLLYTLKRLSVFILAKALKSRVGGSTRVVETVLEWFPCVLEMVIIWDFTENMSLPRVVLPVPYRVGQTPPEWRKLSERWHLHCRDCSCQYGFSPSTTDGVIWVFPGHRFLWIVVGITWRCANISTWR